MADCHSGGRPPKDDRLMVAGMYYILRTGVPWRDLPKEFGPWKSIYTRFRRWCHGGHWSRMLATLTAQAEGSIRCFDCTHIKIHQDGSNAAGGRATQAIGKTKGGLNTKLAAVVDGFGRAVGLNLIGGNRHDIKATAPLIGCMAESLAVGDRSFDSGRFRNQLIAVDAKPCIPPRRSNRIVYYYSEQLYAHRHVVENYFGRIKRSRRVGTRYEKLAETFLGFVSLATIIDWVQFGV